MFGRVRPIAFTTSNIIGHKIANTVPLYILVRRRCLPTNHQVMIEAPSMMRLVRQWDTEPHPATYALHFLEGALHHLTLSIQQAKFHPR